MTDQEVLRGCCRQDRTSQQKLYEKYYETMYWVCYRYMPDRDTAADMVHEGFIKIFRNISKYRNDGSLEGWLKRVMVNCCLDQLRKAKKWDREVSLTLAAPESVPAVAIDDMQAEYILDCIAELPPIYRSVFNMNVIEGYPHKEIAKVLDIKESTSRAYLSEGKKMLRDMLEKQNVVEKKVRNG